MMKENNNCYIIIYIIIIIVIKLTYNFVRDLKNRTALQA